MKWQKKGGNVNVRRLRRVEKASGLHIGVLFTFVFGKVSQFASMVFEWFHQLLVDSSSCDMIANDS